MVSLCGVGFLEEEVVCLSLSHAMLDEYALFSHQLPCSTFQRFLRSSLSVSCHVHVDKLCKDRRAALAKAEAASGFALSPDQCEPAGWASLISRCGPYVFRSTRSPPLVSERGISPWEKPIGRAGICVPRLGHQIWRMRANDRGMDK